MKTQEQARTPKSSVLKPPAQLRRATAKLSAKAARKTKASPKPGTPLGSSGTRLRRDETPVDKVIPAKMKTIIKALHGAGILTLEDCVRAGSGLYVIRCVGPAVISALKQHCRQRGLGWPGLKEFVDTNAPGIAKRHRLRPHTARAAATVLFWEGIPAVPSAASSALTGISPLF